MTPNPSPTPPASHRLWTLQARLAPYLFVLPFILLFCLFLLYPIYRSIVLSFYKSAGPRKEVFIGPANYLFLLKDQLFWLAVANTAAFTLLSLLVQIPVSLILALILNNNRVKLRGLFRFAFFTTHVVGSVFLAVLFSMLLSPRAGLLNRALAIFVGHPVETNWLGEPNLVLPALLLASLWVSVGFGMIYFLAALQAVDKELYEAAEVDGAGKWSQFWNVTLPGIKPVLIFMILIGTIAGFQLFELPYVLFQGGAGPKSRGLTIVMYLFQHGFEAGNLGYAAAIGWVLVLMILAVAILQIRSMRATQES
jgi:ABC-type sugar transport system permease subunit